MMYREIWKKISIKGYPLHPLTHPYGLAAYIATKLMLKEDLTALEIEDFLRNTEDSAIKQLDMTFAFKNILDNKFHLYIQSAVRDGEIRDENSFNEFMLRDYPTAHELKKNIKE